MNTHFQELIIVAVVKDVVGINVFPQHLLQIVFKVSITSDTRFGIAEFSSNLACIKYFKTFGSFWFFRSILILKVIFYLSQKSTEPEFYF